MIGRVLALAGGLSGAAGLSQFPEFSQQYMQRLGGAVDELAGFVEDFDADASALGLTRQEALQELAAGSAVAQKRGATMDRTLARYDRLSADLRAMRSAGPFTRAYNAGRFTDGEIAAAAFEDFRPALPLTFEGAVFGGTGFVAGFAALAALWSLIRMPFRRRPRPGRFA